MNTNLILNTDSYKASHYLQYPSGTSFVSSYIESRGGQYTESVFFGLQAFVKEYLLKPITQKDIDDAETIFIAHGEPFNRSGWQHILDEHQGFLPISIEAVPEGLVMPTRNVMLQVMNTDPQCAWLTSYIETAMLRAIWYPTTVASVSYYCKQIIKRYLDETADSSDNLPFKLHDFGARGASAYEAAALGGMAHLVNFQGTDTLAGVLAAREYYHEEMAGFAIPASEHSTMTAWERHGEVEAYRNMLEQFGGKNKSLSVVSDSYDLWNVVDNIWGGELKDLVENHGGTLVVRPDSGDPVEIVVKVIRHLMEKFGYTENRKGYYVLPDYIRVIQGDGVSPLTIENVLLNMKEHKQSAENIVFGMGASLLQRIDRDTMRFAMKASAIKVNGIWRDIYKNPITDPGKKSKKGRLALIRDKEGDIMTIQHNDLADRDNLLIPVYRNGELLQDWLFSEVREQATV
tara:strand:+ start:35665 stop:37044 length:1380 start_codon:yes stop_codon:yes gene_type:complete